MNVHTDGTVESWTRYRFRANPDDYRPVFFPPPGPYWCSGWGLDPDHSIVIAWFPDNVDLLEWWPEAEAVTTEEDRGPPTFTDRFPRPDWWKPEGRRAHE